MGGVTDSVRSPGPESRDENAKDGVASAGLGPGFRLGLEPWKGRKRLQNRVSHSKVFLLDGITSNNKKGKLLS